MDRSSKAGEAEVCIEEHTLKETGNMGCRTDVYKQLTRICFTPIQQSKVDNFRLHATVAVAMPLSYSLSFIKFSITEKVRL